MVETLDYASPAAPVFPTSLRVVAWLFIAFGLLAVCEIIAALFNSRISINLGVLGIFIGRGIFRLSQGWRTLGLVFLWIGMIVLGICMTNILFGGGSFTLYGARLSRGDALVIGLPITVAFLSLAIWQYRVLTRPEVRRLFGLQAVTRS